MNRQQRIAKALASLAPVGDNPSAEPAMDIAAQFDSAVRGPKKAVYLSPENMALYGVQAPQELEQVQNADGIGGSLFVRNEAMPELKRLAETGLSRERIIGQLTGSGNGKVMTPQTLAVQQRAPNGGVSQESFVNPQNLAEAIASMQGGPVEVTTPQEAIARREALVKRQRLVGALSKMRG